MIITVTYFAIVSVTLHVLTVDTGRVEAVALITGTFISQARGMVPPQTPDTQVKACHVFCWHIGFLVQIINQEGIYENVFKDNLC